MIAEKMFWEVWRNVTSATNNWSSSGSNAASKGSSSKSAQRTRYNRLRSGPTKSISQPAYLTNLASYSSSESLAEEEDVGELHDAPREDSKLEIGKSSGKNSNRQNGNGSTSFMKHSISSFFPFTSCTSSSTSSKAAASTYSPETSLPGKSSSVSRIMGDQQQKESSCNGNNDMESSSSFLSNICSGEGEGGNSNSNNNVYQGSDATEESCSSWDQHHPNQHHQTGKDLLQEAVCEEVEDEISDIDDEVEHLTCDVCDRAFPTLKMLAAHQKKKRHYGCLQCDSIFPSREILECHREQMMHFDYAIDYYDEEEEDDEDGDFLESEDDENGIRDEDCDDEERERLL